MRMTVDRGTGAAAGAAVSTAILEVVYGKAQEVEGEPQPRNLGPAIRIVACVGAGLRHRPRVFLALGEHERGERVPMRLAEEAEGLLTRQALGPSRKHGQAKAGPQRVARACGALERHAGCSRTQRSSVRTSESEGSPSKSAWTRVSLGRVETASGAMQA